MMLIIRMFIRSMAGDHLQVLKFCSRALTGGHKMAAQVGMLKEGVDVAVCTPGRFKQLLEGGHLDMSFCKVRRVCSSSCIHVNCRFFSGRSSF
jgi:superfamily II DNA/RNA helicase